MLLEAQEREQLGVPEQIADGEALRRMIIATLGRQNATRSFCQDTETHDEVLSFRVFGPMVAHAAVDRTKSIATGIIERRTGSRDPPQMAYAATCSAQVIARHPRAPPEKFYRRGPAAIG